MSDFYKRFLLEPAPQAGAPFLALGAFGKHPGWDDHIEDLGLETESLLLARKLLYVEGIGGQIDTGGWEKLKEEQRLEGFGHTFVWERAGQWLLGRMWSSSDGKGRTRYPMIVCAHGIGVPLAWALEMVLPKLREVERTCQGAAAAAAVRSILDGARSSLRPAAAGLEAPASLTEVSSAARREFIASPKFGTGREGLLRIVYALQTQGAAFAVGKFNLKGDLSGLRAHQLRLPLTSPFATDAVRVWNAFLNGYVEPLVPRLLVWSESRGWVDVTLGEPSAQEFLALRAGLGAIPLTTDVPYDLDASFREQTSRQLDEFASNRPIGSTPAPRPSPPVRNQKSEVRNQRPEGVSPAAVAAEPAPPAGRPGKGWLGALGGKLWLIVAAVLAIVVLAIVGLTLVGGGPSAQVAATGPGGAGAASPAAATSATTPPSNTAPAVPTPAPSPRTQSPKPADTSAQDTARKLEEERQAAEKAKAAAALKAEVEAKEMAEKVRLAAEAEAKRAVEAEAKRAAEANAPANQVTATPPSVIAPAATVTAQPSAVGAEAKAATASVQGPLTNSLGMVFVWVPGVPDTAGGAYVGKFEVTQAEYEKAMGVNPSKFPGPRRPVDSVRWNEAVAFCEKLAAAEKAGGKFPAGSVYTLPTQGQWDSVLGDATFDGAVTSRDGPERAATTDVGTLPPNRFGVHDLLGNVWEWCADADAVKERPVKGAAYNTKKSFKFKTLEPTTAWSLAPESQIPEVGFRCWLIKRP